VPRLPVFSRYSTCARRVRVSNPIGQAARRSQYRTRCRSSGGPYSAGTPPARAVAAGFHTLSAGPPAAAGAAHARRRASRPQSAAARRLAGRPRCSSTPAGAPCSRAGGGLRPTLRPMSGRRPAARRTYASSRRFTVSGARSRSRTTCAGAHANPTLIPQGRFSQGRDCLSARPRPRATCAGARAPPSHPPGGSRQRTPDDASRATQHAQRDRRGMSARRQRRGRRRARLPGLSRTRRTAPGPHPYPRARHSRAPLTTASSMRLHGHTSYSPGLGARGGRGCWAAPAHGRLPGRSPAGRR